MSAVSFSLKGSSVVRRAVRRCGPARWMGGAPPDQVPSLGRSDGASVRNHCANVCGNTLCSDLESYVKCSRKRFR